MICTSSKVLVVCANCMYMFGVLVVCLYKFYVLDTSCKYYLHVLVVLTSFMF